MKIKERVQSCRNVTETRWLLIVGYNARQARDKLTISPGILSGHGLGGMNLKRFNFPQKWKPNKASALVDMVLSLGMVTTNGQWAPLLLFFHVTL